MLVEEKGVESVVDEVVSLSSKYRVFTCGPDELLAGIR